MQTIQHFVPRKLLYNPYDVRHRAMVVSAKTTPVAHETLGSANRMMTLASYLNGSGNNVGLS